MPYTVYACETVTGEVQEVIDGNLTGWTRTMNGADTVDAQLNRGTLSPASKAYWRSVTETGRMSLVVDRGGRALAGGPIWDRPPSSDSVGIKAGGIRDILARRKLARIGSPVATQVFSYSGVSLGTIAKRLVQVATDPTKPGAALPLVLPGDESDRDDEHDRTYYGYELKTIIDLLDDLTGVIGGPDIDFAPEWVDDTRTRVQWRMRIGTAAAPRLTSDNLLAWDYSSPESAVVNLTIGDQAGKQRSVSWARGAGEETETLISRAASRRWTDQGWPLLEDETDYTTVSSQAVLDAHTAGDLAAGLDPLVQYTMTVRADQYPELGTYQLGDIASVRVANHWWIPDSPTAGYGLRILGIAGDATEQVKLTVQSADAPGLNIPGSPRQQLPRRIAHIERLLASEQ